MKKVKKIITRNWQLYVLLLPAIIYVLVFSYKPMYGVQIAFRDYSTRKGIVGSDWVGLKHFQTFLNFPNALLLIKNTLTLGIYSLATFPCAVIFALMINEVKNTKFKKTVQMVSYMPHFLSMVVVCSIIKLFFNQRTGAVNAIVEMLGGSRLEFLTIPKYFKHLYVWSGVWQQLGWNSIIYIAALTSVPAELVDAAKVDGANRLQVIRHINIPSIMPTVVIMLILSCGSIMSVGFEKVMLLQNSLNLSVSQVISTYVYEIGLRGGQFSYSAAIGLFNNIVNLVLLLIVNFISKKVNGNGI